MHVLARFLEEAGRTERIPDVLLKGVDLRGVEVVDNGETRAARTAHHRGNAEAAADFLQDDFKGWIFFERLDLHIVDVGNAADTRVFEPLGNFRLGEIGVNVVGGIFAHFRIRPGRAD